VKDYFGLVLPGRRDTAFALAALGVLLAAEYLVLAGLTRWGAEYEKDVITDMYVRARAAGVQPFAWVTFYVAIAGPVTEEMIFRGFLYRGWADTRFGVIPAILVISALFALLHVQYDWLDIFFVFCDGLLLGWVRWRSGSTLLAILLHVVINLWAMIPIAAGVELPS
jgi:membrane protease YdiL (CAAX protease family)